MTTQREDNFPLPASGAPPQRGALSLFRKAEMSSAFLKAGIMGFAGDGKTFTATEIAIGLILHMRKKGMPLGNKPLYFLDTEKGSDWIKPRCDAAGIELMVAKTQSFDDLCTAVEMAETDASVLLVDSVSHFWKELVQSYLKKQRRNSLVMTDWNWLKDQWSTRFTDRFVNSKAHMILCGRAGYEYDHFEDDAGKKQIEKTGIKMRAEGEMGYEPDLVILMEREMDTHTNEVWRVAHILKDRADVIDEKKFRNPTFKDFLPHIARLNMGGNHVGVDTTRNSMASMPASTFDKRQTQRAIVIDEIKALFAEHLGIGRSADEQKRKVQLLRKHFAAQWVEIEEVMNLESLRAGFNTLHREFTATPDMPEGQPSKYELRADKEAAAFLEAQAKLEAAGKDEQLPDFAALGSEATNTASTEAVVLSAAAR